MQLKEEQEAEFLKNRDRNRQHQNKKNKSKTNETKKIGKRN